ncbi:GTPase HflX [Halostagnicola sp. A-GB9-2]|uniref:GTPase HflX n=1 Tax=Halostagnicola sp. A-GB9-2 TaxID=3048066 RepID=UPI0024BFC100|nr:GTPase HflX [Halostagnicola sp. A-GB9-2]MDJ1434653.1 GTPase HflX [Halostagnicola sp. A-GB9-2]
MSRTSSHSRRTVIAKRSATGPIETDEIRALVSGAGHEIVAELTQVGPADPGTYFGRGKVEELAESVLDHGAQRVVVDGELSPSQHHTLESMLPDETAVTDRYRLVLEIFENGAGTRRAQLQVELAQLRYDLPRLIESADEGALNKVTEKGSPVYDVRGRIDHLEQKLAELPDPADQFRERRRDEGFDLVTIAGYTNAGKSTLLHRLADDLSIDQSDSEANESASHSNKDATAAIEDRLFKTLETTTRRATIADRPVLVTDTVGFVDDLPHDLVESFSSTLSEATAADAVVLVVDASDPPDQFRERLDVSLEVLAAQGVDRDHIILVLNKIDLLSSEAQTRRETIAAERVPAGVAGPISVSIRNGTTLEPLRTALRAQLPSERASIEMPNCDEAMSILSNAYDRTSVERADFDGDQLLLECQGRPSVLRQLRNRASSLEDSEQ